jgi:hypothetical protein
VLQYSAVQCSAVHGAQSVAVQCSAVQCSAVHAAQSVACDMGDSKAQLAGRNLWKAAVWKMVLICTTYGDLYSLKFRHSLYYRL